MEYMLNNALQELLKLLNQKLLSILKDNLKMYLEYFILSDIILIYFKFQTMSPDHYKVNAPYCIPIFKIANKNGKNKTNMLISMLTSILQILTFTFYSFHSCWLF